MSTPVTNTHVMASRMYVPSRDNIAAVTSPFFSDLFRLLDTNTIGSVAAVASIAWGCAVQVMAAASIGSSFDDLNEEGGVGFGYTATNGQTL